MNLDMLSPQELIHYLDLYSTDPVVRKLVKMLEADNIIADLVDIGMDPLTQTFDSDWDRDSPAEYIERLRSELEYAQEEQRIAEEDREYAQSETERYKNRSVAELLSDALREIDAAKSQASMAQREAEKLRNHNEDLTAKLNTWSIMTREF
jgi:hypothetical protein